MRVLIGLVLLVSTGVAGPSDKHVVVVDDGRPRAAIFVAPEIMAAAPPKSEAITSEEKASPRQRLRESVNDLARCLEKMSGAKIDIVTGPPSKDDARLPIFIGDLATQAFGPPAKTAPFKQGLRVVVSAKGIGLIGESDLAVSYAVYEWLERLGCRWYMPSELGEVIPESKTIALTESDDSIVPGTIYRGIWFADDAFRRRIRQGGLALAAGHALELGEYVPKKQIAAHPEWFGLVNGKRILHRYCWGNPEVAPMVADAIVKRLDAHYEPTISLSPDDGIDFCECDLCKALDAGDMDPSTGTVSLTDRFVHFANQIASRVTAKYPDVLFGFLAYGPTTRVPLHEKLHPNLVPQIAPITYCRAHTMLQDDVCYSRAMLKPIVEAWGKQTKNVSYYNYMFHLAEVNVPYPMMRQMSDELPILYDNGVNFWQPETMPIFESVLPGMVLSNRMAWNPKLNPAAELDEFFTKFYGSAAAPMRKYWQRFDDAWTKVPEHAGCGFGYARRFTPAFMKEARAAMNEAIAACKTDDERGRVRMTDESLKQFELFMKLRWDLFEGRLANLGAEGTQYLDKHIALGNEYAPQFAFGKIRWTAFTVGGRYFKIFFKGPYDDAGRIAKDFAVISPPLRLWRYQADKETKGESLGWQKADFSDREWKATDACLDTWFDLGFETYYGSMFYRTSVEVPSGDSAKKIFLWISSTDGSAKVFVNGQHIEYVNAKGEKSEEFNGYCQSASFDVTPAIKRGGTNQITIRSTHGSLNELGTGGLIGPVYLYQEKP